MHGATILLRKFTIFLVLFVAFQSTFALAATSPLEMLTEDERLVRWDLTADSLTTLNKSEIIEASGNVLLQRGSDFLRADFARYYVSTKWVFLHGNVEVHMGKDKIKAEEAEFDLRSRVGWLKNGEIFVAGSHSYLSGSKINKHWGDVYTFKDARVTTCDTADGSSPAWSIVADEATVEIDGYARLTNSSFYVKNAPIAYSPYFLFPVKTSRQTGFLVPELGKSSRQGFFYEQPFFWAINDHSDLTVSERFMSDRGFLHGLEYRTTPTQDTKGWARFDWMYDQKLDLDGSYGDNSFVRNNRERYWLRGMFDTKFVDTNWRLKANLDYVSDQDYLREIKGNLGSFDRSQDNLFSWFRRDLARKDEDRESALLLSHDFERATLSLFGEYIQDPSLGHGNRGRNSDESVQTGPQIDAFLHKGRILPQLPLELDIAAQAGHYYRKKGTSGARYEVVPTLTLPITGKLGSIIATAGVRHTVYNTEEAERSREDWEVPYWEGKQPSRENGEYRTIPEFSIAAATEFSKIYKFTSDALTLDKDSVGNYRWDGLRHSIQPRVEYGHRANEDQVDNPYYDETDRIAPRSEIVYSLTNVLTRKRQSVVMAKNDKGEMEPQVREEYIDLVRFKLEQAYDQREADRTHLQDRFERRPFGDVKAELLFGLTPNLDLSLKTQYSPYENELTRYQSGVYVKYPEYGTVYVGYDERNTIDEYNRKRNERIRYVTTRGDVNVWGNTVTFNALYNQDIEDNKNRDVEFGLTYTHQCFSLLGRMSIEPDEESYWLMVKLTGFGE